MHLTPAMTLLGGAAGYVLFMYAIVNWMFPKGRA